MGVTGCIQVANEDVFLVINGSPRARMMYGMCQCV